MTKSRTPEISTFAIDTQRSVNRIVVIGVVAIVLILGAAAFFLLASLPDANAFNSGVEKLFVANDELNSSFEIKLLEILAQSGTTFSETLRSYRLVMLVLMVFATGLLITTLVFLVTAVMLNRRMSVIIRQGIQVSSLVINRDQNTVAVNDLELKLTPAATETLSVLAEARMDDDMLSGSEIEAVISGRSASECDEASGATRIKRLRDTMGNQLISEVLVKNIARQGYTLDVEKSVIRML